MEFLGRDTDRILWIMSGLLAIIAVLSFVVIETTRPYMAQAEQQNYAAMRVAGFAI